MLRYPARIAGLVRRGDALRYCIAIPGPELRIHECGSIGLDDLTGGLSSLHGCRCIYGIGRREYLARAMELPDNKALADPEQLLWELQATTVEPLSSYLYLLERQWSSKLPKLAAYILRKSTYDRVGELFLQRGLTLERLVFEPEALRQAVKCRVAGERQAFLVAETTLIHLLLLRSGKPALYEQLPLQPNHTAATLTAIAEEIGVLMASAFGGLPLGRDVSLCVTGSSDALELVPEIVRSVTYNFTVKKLPLEQLAMTEELTEQFAEYFLPFALCFALNAAEKCESLQANDAASG